MNPLTQIKNTLKATQREILSGAGEAASWHSRFKHSAYVYAGGLSFDMTEGDLLAVFSQYGELVDVNLVRSKETGKSRGFAFLAYEDQRSTVLAVDNLSGSRIAGRTIKVDHVDNYKVNDAEAEASEAAIANGNQDGAAMTGAAEGIEAPRWGHVSQDDDRPVVVPEAERAGPPAGDAPWATSGSVFALLNDPGQPLGAGRKAAPVKEKKRKKEKKEKSHKDKHSKRQKMEAATEPSASPDHDLLGRQDPAGQHAEDAELGHAGLYDGRMPGRGRHGGDASDRDRSRPSQTGFNDTRSGRDHGRYNESRHTDRRSRHDADLYEETPGRDHLDRDSEPHELHNRERSRHRPHEGQRQRDGSNRYQDGSRSDRDHDRRHQSSGRDGSTHRRDHRH